jgi:hypothetical protein
MVGMAVGLALLASAGGDLDAWQQAMCAYTARLQAATAAGLCPGTGACARLDEQPERMCTPGGRADQIRRACDTGRPPRTAVTATVRSFVHHFGLLYVHTRNGKLPLSLYADHVGDPDAPSPLAYARLRDYKAAMTAYAAAPPGPPIATALSGYAWALAWHAQATSPCPE